MLSVYFTNPTSLSGQNLEDAKKHTLNEQFDLASSVFDQLVIKNPSKGDYWFYYGKNLIEADKPDSAGAIFSLGVQNDPGNPLNYAGIGMVSKIKGNNAEAEKLFEKSLSMGAGKNTAVLIRIAEAYIFMEKKNIPKAFELIQAAEKIDPKNPEIKILLGDAYSDASVNDGTSAIKYYEKAQELDPKSPMAMLRIGQLWRRAKNYNGALEYYKNAITIDPNFAPAYAQLGELYAKVQRFEEAKDYYAKYLELSKNNLYARVRYASFLYLTKDYAASISEIKEIWKRDTSRNVLYRLAAYSSYETKDYQNGLHYLERFLLNQPDSKILGSDYAYYGKLLSATGNDQRAIEQLNIALEKDSSQTELYGDLGSIYAKIKNHEMAVTMYQKKIAAGKAQPNDYYRMGQSYYNLKQFENADSAFSKVTEKQPKLPFGYLWRGRTNANLDPESKLGLAKPFYEEVIRIAEQDSTKYQKEMLEALEYLGAFFYIKKDLAVSKDYWEKVKQIDPQNAKAKAALEDLKKAK